MNLKRFFVCVVTAGAVAGAFGCTGFYAGRRVTTDGTTLIGRTMDSYPCNGLSRLVRLPAGGDVKYPCVMTPFVTALGRGEFAGACINEAGLVLSGTVTAQTNDKALAADPFVSKEKGGVGEAQLPGLIARACATAREAVEFLGRTVAARGHNGPEIYMFADKDESWYVEVYTGHQWAAVKMPEDRVACFGNAFMLGTFATNRTDVLYSPRLVATAVEHGFAKWTNRDAGEIDLQATYGAPLSESSSYRAWYGHHVLAPETAGEYTIGRRFDLFYAPNRRISPTDIFELMRSRYEGTNFCPEETGSRLRVIGVTKQMHCHVLQLRHDLPAKFRGTLWFCPAQAEHATFVPVNASATCLAPAWTRDQVKGPYAYDPERAGDAFLRLDTLAEMKRVQYDANTNRVDVRPFYGDGVRAYWRAEERALLVSWPARLTAAAAKNDAAALTTFTTNLQTRAFNDARRILGELQFYMSENNITRGGAPAIPARPFWPSPSPR